MTETTITATQLARQLSDVLNRVKYRGERFVIQRNGETVATIAPSPPALGTTWAEFIARVPDLELPGDGFADDLETIQASQGIAEMPEWPD
jgi:antitoxin (DNA-binding transcriptional repressor) of toxin-antitoxin stability system